MDDAWDDVPDGWSVQPLASCADVLDSKRKPVNSKERAARPGPTPYYGATGQVGWIDDHLFDEELVLLGEDGAPFFDKTKTIAYIIDGKSWVNNHAHVLRARPAVTSNRYLKHFLDYFDFSGYVQGSTRDKLTQGSMNSIPVLLAPTNLQDQIVRTVDHVVSRRSSASAHLATTRRATERLSQAVLASACSGSLTADWRESNADYGDSVADGGEAARGRRRAESRRFKEPRPNEHANIPDVPDTWTVAPLGWLLREIKYGTSRRSEYGVDGVPVLRIPNVSGAGLDTSDLKFAKLEEREARALRLDVGDLLMIRSNGSPQLVGKTVLVTADAVGMTYAGYLVRLRTDREAVEPAFLALALRSPQLRHQIEMPIRSTSGVNNINTEEVRGLVIPVPPLSEQREIVRRASEMLASADRLAQRVDSASRSLDRSSHAVLRKAFRGDLGSAPTEGSNLEISRVR